MHWYQMCISPPTKPETSSTTGMNTCDPVSKYNKILLYRDFFFFWIQRISSSLSFLAKQVSMTTLVMISKMFSIFFHLLRERPWASWLWVIKRRRVPARADQVDAQADLDLSKIIRYWRLDKQFFSMSNFAFEYPHLVHTKSTATATVWKTPTLQ